jgi:enolase
MIMPISQPTFADSLRIATTVYHTLKQVLKKNGLATTVGDEGGFAPRLDGAQKNSEQVVLDLLMQAVAAAGYSHEHVVLALDVAASQCYREQEQRYLIGGRQLDRQGLIGLYVNLCGQFPIFSIEDGMAEEDWDGWQQLTAHLGGDLQLVGDDVFVTNTERIDRGIAAKVANAVLIKPNQIGTVTETMLAIKLAQGAGYKTVVSHRSGETNDPFIADLVVATGAGQFKAGAPARGERVAKYNRLLEIEALLG